MRVNGYINLQLETGGGIDPETGDPIRPVISWSNDIECCWATNHSANNGISVDGKFTTVSYTVDIETMDLPEFDTIRITDSRGKRLGVQPDEKDRVFEVLSIEYADNVNRIRIIV